MNLRHQNASTPTVSQLRPYNERLILDLVRRHGELSKADIARATSLSAQSATVIVNRLQSEGLLKAGRSVRGRVGQPSTPYRVNPQGAASLGIKVGRRSAEVMTMALDYSIIEHRAIRYDYPHIETLRGRILTVAQDLIGLLSPTQAKAIQGVGLAMPDAIWSWEAAIGAPEGAMQAWKSADLRQDLHEALGLPVSEINDASAACLAALKFGSGESLASLVYIYVGTFVGGGISQAGRVFAGFNGFAGSIGSLPTAIAERQGVGQLLERASLQQLEEMARAAGADIDGYYDGNLDDASLAVFERWAEAAAPALAFAALTGQSFLDPESIVLDTSLAPKLRRKLVDHVNRDLALYDRRGLASMDVSEGNVGIHARSIGSALLPFQKTLGLDL